MDALNLLGTVLGLGITSGLNLYATVLAVGVALNLNLLHLPERLGNLEVLGEPVVMVVAGILFAIEFVADKVPWLDSVWDGVHTAIRPIGAAVMGGYALYDCDPVVQTVLALLCGGAALTSHSVKATTRIAVNTSPEPFSNVAISLAEDLLVLTGVVLSFVMPVITLVIVGLFVFLALWLSPKFFRLLNGGIQRMRRAARRKKGEVV